MKTPLALLIAASLVPALHAAPADKKSAPPKPNIVLMVADDLGFGDLGCYGATKIKTPNIDRLAAQGVRLTDAHAPAAVCQPTRYGILAGRYYWRAKKTGNGYYFQDNEILMPEVLRQQGYATAAFGKWHLGWGSAQEWPKDLWNQPINPGPNQAGFDYTFMQGSGHEWPPFVFIENGSVYKGDPKDPLELVKESPAKYVAAYAGGQGNSIGAKAAHAAYDDERLDLEIAKRACDWIGEQKKPFFVYLPFFAPHVPILPSKEFQGTSGAGSYGDFVQQLDHAVGMVLDCLQEKGLAENTLVILTSDNGGCYVEPAMNAGHRANGELLGLKTDSWEGGQRVPFIARWPGKIPADSECDKLLSLTDLFPTVAAATGISLPRDAAPDGVNQLPLLEHPVNTPAIRTEMVYNGNSLRSGDWVYLPAPGNMGAFGTFYFKQFGTKNSQYDDEGKLLPDALPAQLYNLKDDPSQTTNLLNKYPDIAAQMAARLKEIQRQRQSK